MTIFELFIQPEGSDDRYELNGQAALGQYRTIIDLIGAGETGTSTSTSATLSGVDRTTALAIVESSGSASWYHGRQRQPARGPHIPIGELKTALDDHDRFTILYFET